MFDRQVLAPVDDSRVLVIDDSDVATELARRVLTRAGLSNVVTLNDPRDAERVVVELDPDLVLLDLHMPEVDGFEVLRMIMQQSAATYRPVIVLTADDSRDSVERALSLGAHDFLRKPINAAELALRVRNLLLARAAYQELRRTRAGLRTRLEMFEPDLAGVVGEPEDFADDVRALLRDGGVRMVVQPIVDMVSGGVVGGEALARFPDGPLRGTAAWFAGALQVGLVQEVEIAALRAAMALVPQWPEDRTLSMNLSPETVISGAAAEVLDTDDLHRVVLELTEHVPVEDYERLNEALAPMRARGMRVAVDDAGAGFASLRHILDLHPDIIKVDIGITRGVDVDPSRRAVTGMLVRFAEEAGIRLVAEGVETEAERDALLALGARYGQGFLFGRPEPL